MRGAHERDDREVGRDPQGRVDAVASPGRPGRCAGGRLAWYLIGGIRRNWTTRYPRRSRHRPGPPPAGGRRLPTRLLGAQLPTGGSHRARAASRPPVAGYLAQPHEVHRVVLLYSGGLDTSVMLKWIQDEYDAEVVALCIDLGQPADDFDAVRQKALDLGRRREPRGGRQGGVRPRLRGAGDPGERPLPGRLPALHVASAGRCWPSSPATRRASTAPTRSPTAAPARATTRCGSRRRSRRSPPT